MNDNMYVPKSVITRIISHNEGLKSGKEKITNWNVCIKIPYKGFLISLGIDSSLGDNDLKRSDFIVEKDGKDVSKDFYTDPEQYMLYGSMETLLSICAKIDAIESVENKQQLTCWNCGSIQVCGCLSD